MCWKETVGGILANPALAERTNERPAASAQGKTFLRYRHSENGITIACNLLNPINMGLELVYLELTSCLSKNPIYCDLTYRIFIFITWNTLLLPFEDFPRNKKHTTVAMSSFWQRKTHTQKQASPPYAQHEARRSLTHRKFVPLPGSILTTGFPIQEACRCDATAIGVGRSPFGPYDNEPRTQYFLPRSCERNTAHNSLPLHLETRGFNRDIPYSQRTPTVPAHGRGTRYGQEVGEALNPSSQALF